MVSFGVSQLRVSHCVNRRLRKKVSFNGTQRQLQCGVQNPKFLLWKLKTMWSVWTRDWLGKLGLPDSNISEKSLERKYFEECSVCFNYNQKFEMVNWKGSLRKQFEVFELGGGSCCIRESLVCLTASQPLCLLSPPPPPTLLGSMHIFFPRSTHCATAESFDQVPGLFSSLQEWRWK